MTHYIDKFTLVAEIERLITELAEERQRQIEVEGYSAQHDSQHKASEFAYAI